MSKREIRVATHHFWEGFKTEHLAARFPFLARKYTLVPDQERPDLAIFSVFPGLKMHAPPAQGVPTLFLTGENVVPDMARCDFAISFDRAIQTPNHMRIPNWVQRLYLNGLSPRSLLSSARTKHEAGDRFGAFIFRNKVAFREDFARTLAGRAPLDCPGASLNNMAPIGDAVAEKLAFLRQYRFCVAFENESAPGYTTEKLPEALLAGTVPIYWGDPLVGLDFNRAAFLDYADYGSADALADAVMAVEADPKTWRRLADEPAYAGDTVPACADEEEMFAFFERMFDQVSKPAPATLLSRIEDDFAAAASDTISLGFHGDRHLARAIGHALADANILVETGSNRGITLAYAASLRPDIPMRSCEPWPEFLAAARQRCEPYPLVKITDRPSPDSLYDLLMEFPDVAALTPVFWLDAHADGVPLPLAQEVAFITRVYPRGRMFIDDFKVPDRPWFGFDAYTDGTISLDYVLPYLNRLHGYSVTLPRYRERTSTHHPLRGWCCISWNWEGAGDAFADQDLYQTMTLPAAQPQPAAPAAPAPAAPPPSAAEKAVMDWLAYGTYVDERRRILYVETPKCACTSIKHLLRSLNTGTGLAFNPATPETRTDMMIHDRGQIPLRPLTAFQGKALADIVQGEGWFRFCVVRHPIERFFSAWRDKVFLCEPGFERYLAPGRRHVDFTDFYRRIVAHEDPLTCDVHWRMQAALLLPDQIAYSRIYGLNELATLDSDLRQHLSRIGQPADLPPLQRFNEGFAISPEGFLSPEIVAGLRTYYSADFAQFGFPEFEIAPAPERTAADVVNQFTDAVFERNRMIAAHYEWQKRSRAKG